MQYLGDLIKSALLACALILMPIAFLLSSAYSADLELIFEVDGETYDENLGFYVQSPGDLNGDGFSEVYVMNVSAQIKVFNGGHPASFDPIKTYEGYLPFNAWINDINGDGIKDFVFHSRVYTDPMTLSIFLGGGQFLFKDLPRFGNSWSTYRRI